MPAKERIELRLDADVAKAIKKLAEQSDVSVNKLMNGIARWAVQNAHIGKPRYGPVDDIIESVEEDGVVWFGRTGATRDENNTPDMDGLVVFVLDFSSRGTLFDGDTYAQE